MQCKFGGCVSNRPPAPNYTMNIKAYHTVQFFLSGVIFILFDFIRRIEVYEKAEKYSRTCGNRIVIHYTFQADSGQREDAVTDEASEMALLSGIKSKPERQLCLSGYIPD